MSVPANPASVVLGLWQDRPPREVLAIASAADALGYPELWVGEMATWDAFALATAIGAATDRIELTVGPLAVPVRSAMTLAMGTASVAELTGRPVHLAIGTSSTVVVEHWHQRSRARPAMQLEHAATALVPLLAGARGPGGYRLRLPAPITSLTVAAHGPRAVELGGRVADRVVVNTVTPASAATIRERLEDASRRAGRPVPRLAAWLSVCVDPGAPTRAQLANAYAMYLAAPGYGEMFTEAGFGDLVARARSGAAFGELVATIPDELPDAVGLHGSLDDIARRVAAYRAAGIDELALAVTTAEDPDGARTLGAVATIVGVGPAGGGTVGARGDHPTRA